MPYRDAPSEAPCHQCERPTRGVCPICTKPSCDRHFDIKKKMCGRCDEAHYRFMHRESSSGVMLPVVVMFAVAIVPAVMSTTMLPLTIATVFLGFPAVLWYRGRKDRRLFFELMRKRGELPDTSKQPSADEEALAAYQRKMNDRKAEVFVASFDAGAEETPDT